MRLTSVAFADQEVVYSSRNCWKRLLAMEREKQLLGHAVFPQKESVGSDLQL